MGQTLTFIDMSWPAQIITSISQLLTFIDGPGRAQPFTSVGQKPHFYQTLAHGHPQPCGVQLGLGPVCRYQMYAAAFVVLLG